MAELHYRRDDTTPFIIQSKGKAPSIICGQLGVMRLKSSILREIPPDIRYITLTIPPPFYIGPFLWVWYSLNGLDNIDFPSTVTEVVYIWRYLRLFGVESDSTIMFRYIQGLNAASLVSKSPDPLLFSIMTDMLEKIPKKMIPPPMTGRTTPVSLSLVEHDRASALSKERTPIDGAWELPRMTNPPRSMDDIPPAFESNGIDRLYLSLNPDELIPPSMREILTPEKDRYRPGDTRRENLLLALGSGTPDVRVWSGTRTSRSLYSISLDNNNTVEMYAVNREQKNWGVILVTQYAEAMEMDNYDGEITVYDRTPETELVLKREHYPRQEIKLSVSVVPEGKTTYYVGKERFPVQGNIITMSDRSPTILSYYGDFQESSHGSGQREIRREDIVDMGAFLYVWAYLNGQDDIKIPSSKSNIAVWDYIRYFGIPLNSRFVDLYFMQVVNTEELIVLWHFLQEIPKSTRDAIPIFQKKEGTSYINNRLSSRGIFMGMRDLNV